MFPTAEPFISLGITSAGVSMFFITAVVSQLVYTLGGSSFKGGNGSMMIEVVVSALPSVPLPSPSSTQHKLFLHFLRHLPKAFGGIQEASHAS